MAKVPHCLSWNHGVFITRLFRGQLFPIPYTIFARQSYFRHPNQKSFEQKKEVIFYGRLANVKASVDRDLFILPLLSISDKKGFAWNHDKLSRLD